MESEKLLNYAQKLAHIGHFKYNPFTGVIEGSDEFFRIFGFTREQFHFSDFVNSVHPDDRASDISTIESAIRQEKGYEIEHRLILRDGTLKWVRVIGEFVTTLPKEKSLLIGIMQDITKRKQMESQQNLSGEILRILNKSVDLPEAINSILTVIQRETGLEAVGIRLRKGQDYPYFVQNGFSNDFLLTENTLTVRDQDGGICMDKNGKASLECTCGLVLSGKTYPGNLLCTPGGSAWTNNSLPLLYLPADQDPRLHPRNRCIHEGFCSVALIPVRANQEIVGLLQLNDRRKDCFTLEMIQFFEGISANIGMALMRKQISDNISSSLEEKEVLLREIHHRVKNNMQIISSLLNLQMGYVNDKNIKDIFSESQNRILSMALVHEKLYRSSDLRNIDFKDYINNLGANLLQSYNINNIKFNINVENISLDIDLAVPAGLIINELITNSLKYAFPDGMKGEINISFRSIGENMLELLVRDNGIGLPKDLDIRKSKTLGLHLVISLAERQLHGMINLDRSSGTSFLIRFKGIK